mmetsp:Transcript_30951/g.86450  ORF Transcript_30951/g.86450 Transcript_30951/m.86450 type:complete len:141 (+) Transcript_30951:179-601(+)
MSDAEDGSGGGAKTVVSPIANPLAGKKLHKKLFKVVKKAAAAKMLRRGVKEVVKALRKGEKGLCIIAGDISPIDVISHLAVFCEEKDVPYVYVTSKAELGAASSTKRPTSCLLVVPKAGFEAQDKYDEAVKEVVEITPTF